GVPPNAWIVAVYCPPVTAWGNTSVVIDTGGPITGGTVIVVLLLSTACGCTATVTCWSTICCIFGMSTLPRSVRYTVSPGATEIVVSVTGAALTLGFPNWVFATTGTFGTFARVMFCCWVIRWHCPSLWGVM